jgi:hypothetical protein
MDVNKNTKIIELRSWKEYQKRSGGIYEDIMSFQPPQKGQGKLPGGDEM